MTDSDDEFEPEFAGPSFSSIVYYTSTQEHESLEEPISDEPSPCGNDELSAFQQHEPSLQQHSLSSERTPSPQKVTSLVEHAIQDAAPTPSPSPCGNEQLIGVLNAFQQGPSHQLHSLSSERTPSPQKVASLVEHAIDDAAPTPSPSPGLSHSSSSKTGSADPNDDEELFLSTSFDEQKEALLSAPEKSSPDESAVREFVRTDVLQRAQQSLVDADWSREQQQEQLEHQQLLQQQHKIQEHFIRVPHSATELSESVEQPRLPERLGAEPIEFQRSTQPISAQVHTEEAWETEKPTQTKTRVAKMSRRGSDESAATSGADDDRTESAVC